MKIVMTGGGTSGHVTPNIAMFPRLKELGYEIHYIGSEKGLERELIEREGIPYYPIQAGKLRRYLDWQNITDIFRIGKGFMQSLSILGKIRPDVVFSKGGFVSCPVVWAAKMKGIPVVIHESDMTPGLANKLSMPFASKVCYTFPETGQYIAKEKGILTGLPVREAILRGDPSAGRKLCGFDQKKPVVLLIGGSQGSVALNNALRSNLKKLLEFFQVCHICGKGGIDPSLDNVNGYKQFEYVNEELPHLFAMADLIVSRAGATSIFEILALKKPNLLIPLSTKASRGDQILNARSFERQGFSRVLMEEELSPDKFTDEIIYVYQHRRQYIDSMSESRVENGVEKVIEVITEISGHRKQ